MKRKRIPEPNPFSDQPITEAQQLLRLARTSRDALKRASEQMQEAMLCLREQNIPAAAAYFGSALEAVREGSARSDWIESALHDAFGVEVEE